MLSVDVRLAPQRRVAVVMFPTKLSYQLSDCLIRFWRSLRVFRLCKKMPFTEKKVLLLREQREVLAGCLLGVLFY